MKTLLYITCHCKPEELSACKTVGREFLDTIVDHNKDIVIKELNLLDIKLPELKYKYFNGRNSLVDKENYKGLTRKEKNDIAKIKELAIEFKHADFYVIVAPMWSLLFPAPLKEYLDCIIQKDITIKMEPGDIGGLLNDKDRTMVYIQSSGGPIPWLVERRINHGGTYIKDIFKFLGIKHFYEILVDKTGFTAEDQHKAVEKGKKEAKERALKILK